MTTIGKINLEEIKARCEAATEGPWVVNEEAFFEVWIHPQTAMIARLSPQDDFSFGKTSCFRNATFIAHARQDIPALLELVEKQARLIDQADKHFSLFHGCGAHADWLKAKKDAGL